MLRRFALLAVIGLAACSRETDGLTMLGGPEMRALFDGSADAVIEKRDYRVAETLAFPEGARVTIEPGARFFIAPGKSLIFSGALDARGTAAEPIQFLPLQPKKPWGTLGLRGPGTRGSRLSRAVVSGASNFCGRKDCELGGAFSGTRTGVEVREVLFDSNALDAVNLSDSRVVIADSLFRKSGSDAVDLDRCSGKISGNLIVESAEDGVDLAGSHVKVERNHIVGSGHTGVEIGQGSVALLRANTILRSFREGVGIQDESRAFVISNRVVSNACGFRFRIKNAAARWSGRVPGFDSNLIARNLVDFESDASAKIGAAR